jgi:molybdate/tungstate transport system substrate-binding protein
LTIVASDSSLSRRRYLAAAGATAFGSLTGCLSGSGSPVSVLAAGSLASTFEDHVGPAFERETDYRVRGEYHGSAALLRMVEDRTKHPDVVVSADATLLRDRLYGDHADWDVEFASNSIGLCYNPSTGLGDRLEAGVPWWEAARDADDGDLAIGDPDLDPLGYRALMAFTLAEQEHGVDGLRDDLAAAAYREPDEPRLLLGVETGARAGAVVYENMAADHDLPFVGFPDAYDFSDPGLADHYATATYTTSDGYVARGRPILYAATVPDSADSPAAGRAFVDFLTDASVVLTDAGLAVPGGLPRSNASPPSGVDA